MLRDNQEGEVGKKGKLECFSRIIKNGVVLSNQSWGSTLFYDVDENSPLIDKENI